MLLLITQAGYALETDALQNGTAIPKIKDFVIDSGVSVDGETVHTAAYVATITGFENLSAGAMKISGLVPPEIQVTIKGIALRLEDDTIYAYGRYQEQTNGFVKNTGFAFSFPTLLSFSQDVDLTFTYSPLDISALAQQITDQAVAEINSSPIDADTLNGFDSDHFVFDSGLVSQAEAEAGTATAAKSWSALRVRQSVTKGFAKNISENGYIVFPDFLGGGIFQWGKLNNINLNESFNSVVFPIEFPNAVFNIQASISLPNPLSGNTAALIQSTTITRLGFDVAGDHDFTATLGDIFWFAIGK